MKLQKVAFTMYPVKDMQRAGSYCGERLTLGPGSGGPSSPWAGSELPGGGCLAITTVSESQPIASAGGTIAFEVDDLPATIADQKAEV